MTKTSCLFPVHFGIWSRYAAWEASGKIVKVVFHFFLLSDIK
jgi:hypothetical protein